MGESRRTRRRRSLILRKGQIVLYLACFCCCYTTPLTRRGWGKKRLSWLADWKAGPQQPSFLPWFPDAFACTSQRTRCLESSSRLYGGARSKKISVPKPAVGFSEVEEREREKAGGQEIEGPRALILPSFPSSRPAALSPSPLPVVDVANRTAGPATAAASSYTLPAFGTSEAAKQCSTYACKNQQPAQRAKCSLERISFGDLSSERDRVGF